jgi:anthranilate synthase component 1
MPAIVTPVTFSNADTFLALHALNPARYPFLLESAAQSRSLGAFDILMAFPGRRLALRDRNCDFLAELDRWWLQERIEPDDKQSLPFHGGWFLFLGYELAGQIERSLTLPGDPNVEDALAVRIPAAFVRQRRDGQTWIVCEERSAELITALQTDFEAVSRREPDDDIPSLITAQLAEEAPEKYLDAVRRVLEHIAAGDVYQANISRGWQAPLSQGVTPDRVYRRLRRANPAPFAALAELGNRAILSSSPERLLSVRAGIAATRPIAGTRPRRSDGIDDAERLRELSAHPKERAEHVMLIDLERNDLGRICVPGTVEVDEFMILESYAHVHHIVSNVRGRIRADVTPGEAIAAVFPGGTITGCPKVRCMQIIADTEGVPRGAYTGSMGYLNLDGSMDLNILIRTLELRDGHVMFRAGAGIVADSIPERELDETRAKARGLVRAFEQAAVT